MGLGCARAEGTREFGDGGARAILLREPEGHDHVLSLERFHTGYSKFAIRERQMATG